MAQVCINKPGFLQQIGGTAAQKSSLFHRPLDIKQECSLLNKPVFSSSPNIMEYFLAFKNKGLAHCNKT